MIGISAPYSTGGSYGDAGQDANRSSRALQASDRNLAQRITAGDPEDRLNAR